MPYRFFRIVVIAFAAAIMPVHAQHSQPGLSEASGRNLGVVAGPRRIALVIGNDAYQRVSKLEKAGNDATAMARELKAAGFEVLLHRDLNYRGMVKAVETLANSITGGDQVVVFFAGHGVQIKTGSYLLPVDIEASSESEVEKTAYGLADLIDKLQEAKASFVLVMVDACRDNPLRSKGRSIGATRGLSAIEPPKGQMVIYSASKGQQALDRLSDNDMHPNGVFTREFIARMKKPNQRIDELVREVQDAVEELARTVSHDQRPAIYNEARGNFYFFGSGTQVASLGPQISGARTREQIEDELWDAIKGSGKPGVFEAYMREYPKGRYLAQARVKLAVLQDGARPGAVPPAPTFVRPPAGTDPETDFWNEVKTSGAREYFDAYLKQYPKGKYVALAKVELKKLDDQDKAAAAREKQESARRERDARDTEQQRLAAQHQAEERVKLEQARLAKEAAEMRPGKVFKDCADCPEMVVIPAGSFEMGSNRGDADEKPEHTVRIGKPFAIGKTEVTQGQWRALMGGNPGDFRNCGDDCPTENISWDSARRYVQALAAKTGKAYRLPTEAEWEYACRAGGRHDYCGGNVAEAVAWFEENGNQTIHRVAGRAPNAWGLYDMSGNVWEWVEDCYHGNYENAPNDGTGWTAECSKDQRILRGGSWYDSLHSLRLTHRSSWGGSSFKFSNLGLRVARDLEY